MEVAVNVAVEAALEDYPGRAELLYNQGSCIYDINGLDDLGTAITLSQPAIEATLEDQLYEGGD